MKKLFLKYLNSKGLSLVQKELYHQQANRSGRLAEMAAEFYVLARNSALHNLPPKLSDAMAGCVQDMIGTSPFEGLSILDSLYKTKDVKGDICEFGIAQGATSKMLATWIMEQKSDKRLWLFDSFEGLSAPTSEDQLKDDIFSLGSIESYGGQMAFEQDVALSKLRSIDYPKTQLEVVPGFIETTIKGSHLPAEVSFAYVDFDLYQPIKVALEFLQNTLAGDGLIIVDDYDFFSTGAKKAVDEFVQMNRQEFTIEVPDKQLGHFCILQRKHADTPHQPF